VRHTLRGFMAGMLAATKYEVLAQKWSGY